MPVRVPFVMPANAEHGLAVGLRPALMCISIQFKINKRKEIIMSAEMKNFVLNLLDTYQDRE